MSESEKKTENNNKKGEENVSMNPELEELFKKRLDKNVTVTKIEHSSDKLPLEKKELLDKLKERQGKRNIKK